MSQSLREIWGLGSPQAVDAAATEQGQQFRKSFAEKVAVINEKLKQAAPYGTTSDQSALDAQRKTLYAAYQKVVSQMGTGEAPAKDADRVLAAAESLCERTQAYAQEVETARQQWSEREPELQEAMDKVVEMQDADHEKAYKLRAVIEKIQSHANDGNYSDSANAVDQFLPKLDPIYNDFRNRYGEGPSDEYGDDPVRYNDQPVEYEAEPAIGGNNYGAPQTEYTTGVALGEYGGESMPADYGSDVIDHGAVTADSSAPGGTWDDIKQKASETWDDAGDATSDAGNWAKKKVDAAASWTSDTADDVKNMATGGDSRPLTEDEIAYAKRIFGDKVDYSKIRVVKGSAGSIGAPRTLGNSVHMSDDQFDGNTMQLSEKGIETLVHEMTHVHQFQKDGWEYAPEALWSQLKAYVTTGDRNNAYDWEKAEKDGQDPTEWNPEQQAELVEQYNKLLKRQQTGETLTSAELEKLNRMKGHVDTILNSTPQKDIIDSTVEVAEEAWDWTSKKASEAWDGAGEIWDDATDAASEAWDSAKETAEEVWDDTTEAVEDAWDSTKEKAEELWNDATDTASDAWDGAKETAGEVWDGVTETAGEVWDSATETASETWDSAKETASETYDAVTEGVSDATDYASEKASEAADYASDKASEAYNAAADTASSAYNTVADTASGAVDAVSDAASSVGDATSEAYDDVSDAAGKAWDSVFG